MEIEASRNIRTKCQIKTSLDVAKGQKSTTTKFIFKPESECMYLESLTGRRLQQNLARERKQHMEAKLLEVVTEHPNGITLAEAAESLGVVHVVLGRVARRLLKNSKIRKANKIYFPVMRE